MVRKCFVENCISNKSNSNSDNYSNLNKFSLHAFPSPIKDHEAFLKWIEFCQLDKSLEPYRNLFTIQVEDNKSVEFYSNGIQLDRKLFLSYFSKKYFITSLCQFDSLLEFISLNHLNFFPETQEDTPLEKLRKLHDCSDLIDFFEEQLNNSKSPPQSRKYTTKTIIFSFIIFSKSRTAYFSLLEHFFLPSERTLRRYSSSVGGSLKSDNNNFEYFQKQCEALPPHERDITLKYDEIQIKSKIEFRSGQIFGYAENREGEVANHLQCFMIRSLKSKYREMVKLSLFLNKILHSLKKIY